MTMKDSICDKDNLIIIRADGYNLSEYERIRALNIQRNNARLKRLGLISAHEENRSNAAAWGKTPQTNQTLDNVANDFQEERGSKLSKKRNIDESIQNLRKSPRLHGVKIDEPCHSISSENNENERKERVDQCREARLLAAKEVFENGADSAAKQNPTASYEHCLMRVKTMTHNALINRVKAIERAAGRHCVIKMAIFKCCLQDEGLWDLADLASEALERLKAFQPSIE